MCDFSAIVHPALRFGGNLLLLSFRSTLFLLRCVTCIALSAIFLVAQMAYVDLFFSLRFIRA